MYHTLLEGIFPASATEKIIQELSGRFPLHISTWQLPTNTQTLSVISLSDYSNNKSKALIHGLKYIGNTHACTIIAQTLSEYLLQEVSHHQTLYPGDAIYIIPIPLSKKRKSQRGFNQIERVLRKVMRLQPELAPYIALHVLQKHRNTPSQTHLSRTERLQNVRNAFSCKPIPNTHIILVDDVVTTGATLRSASDTLFSAGAKSITPITFARALS